MQKGMKANRVFIHRSTAFTLIEILVVLVIGAFLMTIITKRLRLLRQKPAAEWSAVLDEFNNMLQFARQEAITGKKNYRLLFKKNIKEQPDFVIVQIEEQDTEHPDKKRYKQVDSDYFKTKYVLPREIKMEAFYQNSQENMFDEQKGEGYCYVVPNGLSQDCMIHLTKKEDVYEDRATFQVQTFIGEFEHFDDFVKPVNFRKVSL
jgi:prepilin-type N-terminal cleavage/methylation domain-containing protein